MLNLKHRFMRKNHFLACMKTCAMALMGVSALFLGSCAEDGYDDDERFGSDVQGVTLESPSADGIQVTPIADGKSQTISWRVVNGAGGYLVSLYDEGNLDVPIVKDSLVDGCSLLVSREEDMNYLLTIQTQGNSKYNNSTASSATSYKFTTFAVSYATIPDGSDLLEYFTANPVPDQEEAVYYDLVHGGHYTLSGVLDFSNHKVVLRTNSKSDFATITYGAGGSIEYCGGITLKYLNFECGESSKPVLAFSATPAEGILDTEHNNHNQIVDPTSIQNCHFHNVKGMLLYDNKVKYCLKTFLMDNCTVHLNSEKMENGSVFYIYDGGGFINDFTINQSTIWSTGGDQKYLIRYNNACRCDRAGYTTNSINITHSTMYKVCYSGQMCNHSGFDGRNTSNYEVIDNIFVDCGGKQVPRRIVARTNAEAQIKFNNNTYWYDGAPEPDNSQYDNGYQLTTDPAFRDPANGDFTPTGAEQLSLRTGDPRWLP